MKRLALLAALVVAIPLAVNWLYGGDLHPCQAARNLALARIYQGEDPRRAMRLELDMATGRASPLDCQMQVFGSVR